jgi:hypothetical protein
MEQIMLEDILQLCKKALDWKIAEGSKQRHVDRQVALTALNNYLAYKKERK